MIEVRNFVDCPDVLPMIAEKIYCQWFKHKAGHSVEGLLCRMKSGLRNEVPIGLVAYYNGIPAGTVSLLHEDLEERKDLTPWLAGLLVFPDFRRLGIGANLVRKVQEISAEIRIPKIYLYTEIPEFYVPLGWKDLAPVPGNSKYRILSYTAKTIPA